MSRHALIAIALLATGCASDYIARASRVHRMYESGDFARAATQLEEEKPGSNDRLLYLLDKGMMLHAAGKWVESNAALTEAEKLAPRLDYTSVSEEAKSLMTSDASKAFRCEDYELLLVNILKAINYAMLGQDEEALVEVRRSNQRTKKMSAEEKKPYEQLAIASFLNGALYERVGDWDAASIDYTAAIRKLDDLGDLAGPIMRVALSADRTELFDELKRRHPDADLRPLGADEGEVLVILERGLAPRKFEYDQGPRLVAVPRFRSRLRSGGSVTLTAGDGLKARTVVITSIDKVAQRDLDNRLAGIVAKSAAGAVAKVGAGVAVAEITGSETLGQIMTFGLAATNRADLRSWLSLPGEFQAARMRLPAGLQKIAIPTARGVETLEVEVNPKRLGLAVVRVF